MVYNNLREANVARQIEWNPPGEIIDVGVAFALNELAGEVGEVCNVLKKLERESLNLPGSRATVEDLAEELADVLICLDLLAIKMSDHLGDFDVLSSQEIVQGLPITWSPSAAGKHLATKLGAICASHGYDWEAMEGLAFWARVEGLRWGINLDEAIVSKFNKTSEKVGLSTRLQ